MNDIGGIQMPDVTRVISAYVAIMKNYDRSSIEEMEVQKSLRNGGK